MPLLSEQQQAEQARQAAAATTTTTTPQPQPQQGFVSQPSTRLLSKVVKLAGCSHYMRGSLVIVPRLDRDGDGSPVNKMNNSHFVHFAQRLYLLFYT